MSVAHTPYAVVKFSHVLLFSGDVKINQAPIIHPCDGRGFGMFREVIPVAMRPMTQHLVDLDNQLTTLQAQLHDNTWEPAELDAVRVEIDQLLEQRQALTDGA